MVRIIIPIGILLCFLAIILATPTTPRPHDALHNIQFTSPKQSASIPELPAFEDRTLEAGLMAVHFQGGKVLTGLDETLGAGACAFDYDDDDFTDLFVVGGSGHTRYYGKPSWWQTSRASTLYRNLGNGRFEDVTDGSGIQHQGWGMGCISGDLDNDGDPDLFITNLGENTLLQNNGDGTFSDITDAAGIEGSAWSTSAALGDYDDDGLLDIYVVNYIRYDRTDRVYEAQSGFRPAESSIFDASLYDGAPNKLLRNKGGLVFEDTTRPAGVANIGGRGLAAVWLDINSDRRQDLLVTNDTGQANAVYINQGDGTFGDQAADLLLNSAEISSGMATGDIDNDGDTDLAIGTSMGYPTLLFTNEETQITAMSDQGSQQRRFIDIGRDAGIGDEFHVVYANWGLGLHDFNNDGWQDLFAANGLAVPDHDAPKTSRGQSNQLWLNRGDQQFLNVTGEIPILAKDALSSRAAVFADFDNDGDIDVYVTQNNNLGQFLVNETAPSQWIGVKLIGKRTNHDAIGARVTIKNPSGIQSRAVTGSPGFLSGSDKRLHFGLDGDKRIDAMVVEWPDGSRNEYQNLVGNQYIEIAQDGLTTTLSAPVEKDQPVLMLQTGKDEAALRTLYIGWLLDVYSLEEIDKELWAAIQDPVPGGRLETISRLGSMDGVPNLPFLLAALEDTESGIRVEAVNALSVQEDEVSVRWLLRMFDDPDETVRCAVSEAFAGFYREEEAVVVQKYLAVPHLIRLLEDNEPAVRACAARALGDAERYRALHPLTSLLQDPATHVRTEAARALGLLREQQAIPHLLAVLQDPEEDPHVRAQALVALKRLNYDKLDEAFDNLLPSPSDRNSQATAAKGLQVLLDLLRNPGDGVVIAPHTITSQVSTWSEQAHLKGDERMAILDPHALSTLLAILVEGKDKTAVALAEQLTQHTDPRVRARAYSALINLEPSEGASLLPDLLADNDSVVQEAGLQALVDARVQVPVDNLSIETERSYINQLMIKLLAVQLSATARDRLYSVLLDAQSLPEEQLLALDGLIRPGGPLTPLPDRLFSHPDARFREKALRYWSIEQAQTRHIAVPPAVITNALHDRDEKVQLAAVNALLARKEAWARRHLEQVLLDSHAPQPVRQTVLDAFAESDTREAREAILRLAKLRHDPFSIAAVDKLGRQSGAEADRLLWSILNNPQDTQRNRFAAAGALMPRHSTEVLAKLRKPLDSP